MKEQIVSLETAKLLYELGYRLDKENTLNWYIKNGELIDSLQHFFLSNEELDIENIYAAPTQSLVQKWLREKHNIHVGIYITDLHKPFGYYISNIVTGKMYKYLNENEIETYEEALEKGLQEAIKIIKDGIGKEKKKDF